MFKKRIGTVVLLMVVAIVATLTVAQFRALRYPRITFDPLPQPLELVQSGFHIKADGAYLKTDKPIIFRAFRPAIELDLSNFLRQDLTLILENIHPAAVLKTHPAAVLNQGYITEISDGLTRRIHITARDAWFKLSWHFPDKKSYRFGVLGDTGGDRELDWGLKRISELEVDFILHMGDLYYFPSEVGQVHERFNHAQVPVYATIGNHDFRGPEGNSHDIFSRNIGPLNSMFRLLDTCFINVDTGAATYPADAGYRAQFMAQLMQREAGSSKPCGKIIYTHKPFTDGLTAHTIPDQDHSLGGYQAKWLRQQFAKMGHITLLSGHIHDDFEFSLPGIKTYVVGSGLAGHDLITGVPVSRYLIGEISQDHQTQFTWVSGDMPLAYHCSKKVWSALESQSNRALLARLRSACGQ